MLTKPAKTPAKSKTEAAFTLRYLDTSEDGLWDALVDASPQGSVFCRPWWLNVVGNARVLGCFSGNDLIAGIPLYFETRFGIPVCTMPKLTQTWGVVMRPLEGKTVAAASRETKILRTMARHLSKLRLFFQAFHPNLSNWLPFYWSGFRQTTRFTYVIEDLIDLNRVWHGISDSARGQIKKAERAGLHVVRCGIDEVYRCECLSYSRHRKLPSHSQALLTSIYDAAREHDSGACMAVADAGGTVHSAWLLVWDKNRAYELVGGSDAQLRNSGANVLGTWAAIQFAAQRTRAFDFAGSVLEGIERFNRTFGATQVPYNFVFKAPTVVNCILEMSGKL